MKIRLKSSTPGYVPIFLLFILFWSVISIKASGQSKYSYTRFNDLMEIEGTSYIIASLDNRKKVETRNKYLLFINTSNGESTKIEFPGDSRILEKKQVKIDSLGINRLILKVKTVDLNRKAGIEWSDPSQIIALSIDGKNRVQLTEDNFFTNAWSVNRHTGSLVITGHLDSNKNGKYDKRDKNKILIFDLGSLELVNEI